MHQNQERKRWPKPPFDALVSMYVPKPPFVPASICFSNVIDRVDAHQRLGVAKIPEVFSKFRVRSLRS